MMLRLLRFSPRRFVRHYGNVLLPGSFLNQTTPESEKLSSLLKRADANKAKFINIRKTIQTTSLVNWLRIRLGYSSNALEGNTLSERDVYYLIQEGITIDGKPISDIRDVQAHDNALKLLFDASTSKISLDPELIKKFHRIVMPESRPGDPPPGDFKKEKNFTFTTWNDTALLRMYAFPEDVRDRVAELMFWLRDNEAKVHPLHLASIGHYNVATIHPFPDGNGRIARLLMNALLIRHDFTPAIIEPFQRVAYITALETSRNTDNILPFTEFLAQTLVDSQEPLLELGSFTRSPPQGKVSVNQQ